MEASTPFDSWDPMVLDSLAAVNKPSRTPAEEAAAQKQSVKSYWAAVNSKVCGSLRGWVSAFLGIYPSEFVGILDRGLPGAAFFIIILPSSFSVENYHVSARNAGV